MDLSAKKLTAIFTLAAGVTFGGFMGAGTLYYQHAGGAAQVDTVNRTAGHGKTPSSTRVGAGADGNTVEAVVVQAANDDITVRAHTWVGQFTVASVCPKDSGAPKPCHYAADITDAAGTKLTSFRKGQTVYLHGLEETGASGTPPAVTAEVPNLRPRTDVVPGPVRAHVVKDVDGDTFEVMAEIWKGTYVLTDIRVNGIDTPEKKGRAKCEHEAELAEKASAATRAMVEGKDVLLYNVQYEKYGGRVLGDVKTMDGQSVGDNLVKKGLARPYDGGTKQSWCK